MIDRLGLILPALGERALRASGLRLGNRIPGTRVLWDTLAEHGWNIHELFDVMSDMQRTAELVCVGGPLSVLEQIEHGNRMYRSTGGRGECRCLLCRIRRMWLEEWGGVVESY